MHLCAWVGCRFSSSHLNLRDLADAVCLGLAGDASLCGGSRDLCFWFWLAAAQEPWEVLVNLSSESWMAEGVDDWVVSGGGLGHHDRNLGEQRVDEHLAVWLDHSKDSHNGIGCPGDHEASDGHGSNLGDLDFGFLIIVALGGSGSHALGGG